MSAAARKPLPAVDALVRWRQPYPVHRPNLRCNKHTILCTDGVTAYETSTTGAVWRTCSALGIRLHPSCWRVSMHEQIPLFASLAQFAAHSVLYQINLVVIRYSSNSKAQSVLFNLRATCAQSTRQGRAKLQEHSRLSALTDSGGVAQNRKVLLTNYWRHSQICYMFSCPPVL